MSWQNEHESMLFLFINRFCRVLRTEKSMYPYKRLSAYVAVLFLLCVGSSAAQQTPNNFFARGIPSLGIYSQQFLETYVNRNPQLTKGYNLLVEFKFDKAREVLKVVAGDLKNPAALRSEALAYLGYVNFNTGDIAGSKLPLKQAIDLNPKNAVAQFFLANTFFQEGDFDSTKHYLKEAIRHRPNFVAALRMLAETYKDERNLEESARYYRKIIELLPHSGYYLYQYYKVNKIMGNYPAMEKTIQRMINLEPRLLLNYIRLGETYVEMDKFEKAMEQFNYVIGKDPKNSRAYEGRAKVYLAKKDFENAMEEVMIARRMSPNNAYINSLLLQIRREKAAQDRKILFTAIQIILVIGVIAALIYFYTSHRRKQYIISVIHEFNRSVDDLYDLDSLIIYILNFYMKLGSSRKGIFLLFNRQNNQLVVKEKNGTTDQDDVGFSLFAGDEITNWLTSLKRYVLTREDLERDTRFDEVFPSLKERLKKLHLRYIFPLRDKNQLVGFVALDSFDSRTKGAQYQRDLLIPISTTTAQTLSAMTLYETSISDETTGLYNKRYFRQNLSQELKRADRYNQPVSLVTFDIDNFKRLNDTYGHPQGDVVLKELGDVIRNTFREGIDVGARTGGEEFTCILPATDPDKAKAAAERLRSAVQDKQFPGFPEGSKERVTVSIGVATYPVHVQSGRALIEKSDEALYTAKRSGKNRVCMVDAMEESEVLNTPDTGPLRRQTPVAPALLDEVSGLYARGYFDERFIGEVKRAERSFRPCSLLMIKPDVSLPHTELVGIFKDVARIMRVNLRRGIDVPARYESDIVIVLLPEVDQNRAAQIARRIKMAIDKSTPLSGNKRVTFSIGVSNYPNLGRTGESFMESARQSLRMCQQMGGDRAMIATPL